MIFVSYLRANASFLGAGMLLTFTSSFGQTFFISMFSGEIRSTFGLSNGEWGKFYAWGTLASALVMVWAGAATDVVRVRILAPLVFVGLAVACGAMALNPFVWALPVIIFALRFFGQGMSSHLAVVAMTRWFVVTRGRALAIAALGFSLGEALLPMIFVAALTVVAWQVLWWVAAALCVLAMPLLAYALRFERTPQRLAQSNRNTGMDNRHWHRSEALRHPLFWCMMPAILGVAAFNTAFFFHHVHLMDVKGWTHLNFVSLIPLYTGLTILVMILSGWALDRFGSARLIPFYQTPMIAAFIVLAIADTPSGLALGFVLLAMTSGANATLPNAFWAEFYGTRYIGGIKALAAAAMVFGSALGPWVTGAMIDTGIRMHTQFIGVSIFFAAATIIMCLGIQRAKHSLPNPDL